MGTQRIHGFYGVLSKEGHGQSHWHPGFLKHWMDIGRTDKSSFLKHNFWSCVFPWFNDAGIWLLYCISISMIILCICSSCYTGYSTPSHTFDFIRACKFYAIGYTRVAMERNIFFIRMCLLSFTFGLAKYIDLCTDRLKTLGTDLEPPIEGKRELAVWTWLRLPCHTQQVVDVHLSIPFSLSWSAIQQTNKTQRRISTMFNENPPISLPYHCQFNSNSQKQKYQHEGGSPRTPWIPLSKLQYSILSLRPISFSSETSVTYLGGRRSL